MLEANRRLLTSAAANLHPYGSAAGQEANAGFQAEALQDALLAPPPGPLPTLAAPSVDIGSPGLAFGSRIKFLSRRFPEGLQQVEEGG